MFLKTTMERNARLIDAGFTLHQTGCILPDTYILDVDVFLHNAAMLLAKARKSGLTIYYMSKQIGRNPYLCQVLDDMGFDGAVCVDYKEALVLMKHQCRLGNVGHLVQTPKRVLSSLIAYGVEIITVYSVEKILEIEEAASACDKVQHIMLKVMEPTDMIYPGQVGGFHLQELSKVSQICKNLTHVRISGVTAFPCFLYEGSRKSILPTPNLYTVLEAKRILQEQGEVILQVNTPSSNVSTMFAKIAAMGGNTVEPGHAFIGTTPYHQEYADDEQPAMIYVSEVSHNYEEKGYCYGGGHYRRSHMHACIVGSSLQDAQMMGIQGPQEENIDYHFTLEMPAKVSDTVIAAYRTQIFTTRSHIALVKGIQSGAMELLGIYDSQGNRYE